MDMITFLCVTVQVQISYLQLGPQETSQTDAEDKLEDECPRCEEPDL